MLLEDDFIAISDSLGEQKRVLQESMLQVNTGLSNNKARIGQLDNYEDSEKLVPAMKMTSQRIVSNRLFYTGLTPLTRALFDAVGGSQFLADNDIRVTEDFKDLLDYLGIALEPEYVMTPVIDLEQLDVTEIDIVERTNLNTIDISSYGKAYFELVLSNDFLAESTFDITCSRLDGTNTTHTVTVPAGSLTGDVFSIGDHTNKDNMYIDVFNVTLIGGTLGDQAIIRIKKEREPQL
ncbi:hypothetical protein U472_00470 [Orenia metallireducens]|uniref:Uncharacterized protein n=1 Tax=Orenia metallireducens TaxID=1413210 RepID=A0A1C0ADC9_9FIRM|nr:hypothetical protein [Orenia metallireducens]OCL28663.1 hypothetical protein U472_00470 [Orenia metallireducens]